MFSMPTDIGFVEARKLIDEECRNSEKRILLLKSQRNTFTDIARIPDEVLLDIFSILKTETDVKAWFGITQTCRYWRGVSIDAPSLWTNPPTDLYNLTLLFLERSMPLCLDIRFDSRTSTATAIAVMKHIQRVQTLNMGLVQVDSLIYMQKKLQGLDCKASNLKELFISPKLSTLGRFRLSASTFRCPVLLEKLRLRFLDFDWTMLPLPNLTTLSLTQITISVELSWENFLRTLAAMPLLETIQINFLEIRLHTPSTSAEMVTLPHLSELKISGASDTQIRYFATKVTLPLLDRAQLICTTDESNDDHLPTVQALSCLIEEGNFDTLDTMLLGHGNFALSQQSDHSNKEFAFSYRQCIRTEQEAVNIIMNTVLRMASLNCGGISTLVRASLCGYGTPIDNDIVDLFAGLPLLESITLCDEMAMPFIERLFIPTYTPATGNIPFANLKVISFYEQEETQFCSELFHKLLDCLVQRCEYGAPIQELLVSWTLAEKELRTLREIVVDVYFELYGGIVRDNSQLV
jgi:hypothetical protein